MPSSSLNRAKEELHSPDKGPELIGFRIPEGSRGAPLAPLATVELAERAVAEIKAFLEQARKGLTDAAGGSAPFLADPHRLASREVRQRQKRNALLGDDLFSDPAWDILLLLYSALPERDHLIIRDFSVQAGIPVTTALRWVSALEHRGLVTRRSNPHDRRAANVSLSELGNKLMTRYFVE